VNTPDRVWEDGHLRELEQRVIDLNAEVTQLKRRIEEMGRGGER